MPPIGQKIKSLFQQKEENSAKQDNFNFQQGHEFHSSCYAPFTSLYFGHWGKAQACCQNRNYILGTYPTDSIQEIWSGEKADELRVALRKDNFTLGCEGCNTQRLSGNIEGMKSKPYDSLPISKQGYPTEFQFELSNVCNLECQMCSGEFSSLIRKNREKRPPVIEMYDEAFVEQLKPFLPHLRSTQFYGGEPFLIDIYYPIWDAIAAINPSINVRVQTNGTVLNNRIKTLLEKTKFSINVSIDSINPETYPKIRINGKLSTVLENIKWFSAYCKEKGTDFGISVCAMQQNWQELPELVEFANEHNAQIYFHSVINPASCSIRTLPKEKIIEIYNHLKGEAENLDRTTDISKSNAKIFDDYLNDLKYFSENKLKEYNSGIQSMDEFYVVLEKTIDENLPTYKGNEIVEKLRTTLKGLEKDESIIKKFRHLNLEQESTLREMVNAIHVTEPAHLRELTIGMM